MTEAYKDVYLLYPPNALNTLARLMAEVEQDCIAQKAEFDAWNESLGPDDFFYDKEGFYYNPGSYHQELAYSALKLYKAIEAGEIT